jgi:uncharacterized SAM-binding protein YcdF (DUF218 family)
MSIGELLGQLVKLVLLPPASLLLLFALGSLLRRRHRRLGASLCMTALGLLYFLCTGVGSWLLVHRLEQLEPALSASAGRDAGAVVVLAAGAIKGSPEYAMQAIPDFIGLERMAYGAYLVRARRLPLLLSGGVPAGAVESLAAGMRRVVLDAFGLPVTWIEERSRNSEENAQFSALMLKRAGIARIILVTDALHMRRAKRCFERAGIAVTPGPTFYHEPGSFDPLRLLPSAENLRRSHYALYEWLALARDELFAS